MRARIWQALLIVFAGGLSWLAMMGVHELGHVVNAALSGGHVERVVLHPWTISRTDLSPNPSPRFVAWGGAVWGTAIPLALLVVVRLAARSYAYLAAFFAGFCCLANGLYLAAGSFGGVGDAGDLLRHGAGAGNCGRSACRRVSWDCGSGTGWDRGLGLVRRREKSIAAWPLHWEWRWRSPWCWNCCYRDEPRVRCDRAGAVE